MGNLLRSSAKIDKKDAESDNKDKNEVEPGNVDENEVAPDNLSENEVEASNLEKKEVEPGNADKKIMEPGNTNENEVEPVLKNKLNSGELTPRCCGEISYKIGSDWHRLGKKLSLSDADLDCIDADYIKCYDKADKVLKKWKEMNGNPSWRQLKKELISFGRLDVVRETERNFIDLSTDKTSYIECRIQHGCVFKFDLCEDEVFIKLEYQLCNDTNNWTSINNKKHAYQYHLTKKKKNMLFVKVENLVFENEEIIFKFSFEDSNKKGFQQICSAIVTGDCNYEINYNGLFILTPEPSFNNEFSKNIKLKSLDWRAINNICLDKVPYDKSIESFGLDYFNRNFPDSNDVIYVSPSITDNNNFFFIVSKFINLFNISKTGVRAVLPGYRLRYHASLLKFNVEKFRNYQDENRIAIFCSEYNLVIIARVATSIDCLKLELEKCLSDIILFVNVNSPLINTNALVIMGIVVLPLCDRNTLKEELFFHFTEKFDLDEILFLCKDDIDDENFYRWWRSVIEYCIKKNNTLNKNEELFKKLVSLTMMIMAKVDKSFPTLESDTQKQIQSLILNMEQRNAINDKELKKIITGGYGSGKSIVGMEIVKNCIKKNSENPFILYYICCNHFSLYECHMKEFVDSLETTSNVKVVCQNLYELWKTIYQKKNVFKNYISLPELLEYLANTNSNKVGFVLEELSEEYVKKEDAIKIKHLLNTVLKESLVVFIPESITKVRELVSDNKKETIRRNFFQEEVIGMKVMSLNKSMRVTASNKLVIDIAQKSISETKSVLIFPNLNNNISQEIEKNELVGHKDLQIVSEKDLQCLIVRDSKNENKNETGVYISSIPNKIIAIGNDDSKNETKNATNTSVPYIPNNIVPLQNLICNNYISDDLNEINSKNNYCISVKVKKEDNYGSSITNDKNVNKFTDSAQFSKKTENKGIDDFHDYDLDYMSKLIEKSNKDNDPSSYMKTEYVFKTSNIGHSIKGEKPKVLYLPFHNITDKQSIKLLSIVLESLCVNVLRRTVVICNDMEEVKSVAYAIDIIGKFKAVTYSPHLQKYSPTLEQKKNIQNELKNCLNVLVTDCKGFSGAESESVIVFVSPEEIYLRHLLVDAMSRSNSYLTILVKNSNDKETLNKDLTLGNVLSNWSEDVVEKITVTISNEENRTLFSEKENILIIYENCKDFTVRGAKTNFDRYIENLQFQVFHENNSIYKTMAINLSKKARKEYKKISVALKDFYNQTFENIDFLRSPINASAKAGLLNKYIDLGIAEGINFEKPMNYKPISYNEVFMEDKAILLISGIAGIGKSCLLKKCLLDWANNLIWKKVDFVFYFECRLLNKYHYISNIKELLCAFYKNFVKDLDINNHNILFMIDGLDDFKYLDDLINNNSFSRYAIVNVLSEIQKYKSVVSGRIYAIDQYQRVCQISKINNKKLTIQIMGFDQNGINNYIENNVVGEKKELVKTILQDSRSANVLASVPFYLSVLCKIVESKQKDSTLSTMTNLYTSIFFHFYQEHITKTVTPIDEIMENDYNKKYILSICKMAYESYVKNKIIFSREEVLSLILDFDKLEYQYFGFIERIKTDLGNHYKFAHSAIIEFCASVYAYNNFSGEEIVVNEMLKNCLSTIFGLTNKSQNCLLKFLVNLNNSNKKNISIIHIFNHLRKFDNNLFIECFYESQSSFDEIKSFNERREWWTISIRDGKTSYETSCENYFVNHLIKSGRKLTWLTVRKNILSDEEKSLIMICSTHVHDVTFYLPISIEGWKPKDKIEVLAISIQYYLISKKEFENFFPWINVCEKLNLYLHKDIDYIEDIIEWIRCSNIKRLAINYRGEYFYNLDELKNFIT